MAEILISLTIIGVIAAITLPALQANINESAWRAQRKALYSRMSQAISMMPSLNGYGEFVAPDENGENGKDTVAMSFVTNGLGKVFELKNICDYENLGKCGIPDKIKAVNGTTFSTKPDGTNPLTTLVQLNPKFHGTWTFESGGSTYSRTFTGGNIDNFAAAGFETKNGESVIAFYNPYCVDYETAKEADTTYYPNGFRVHPQILMCANFIYDLNGKKGPNTVGKDIGFITALYPTDPALALLASEIKIYRNVGFNQARQKCRSQGDYRLLSREEMFSLFYNSKLIAADDLTSWSSERFGSDGAFNMNFNYSFYQPWQITISGKAACIKR